MPLLLLTQRSESVRQRGGSSFTTLQTNPTASQKASNTEGYTTRVRRHIGDVASALTIRHRGQAELAVLAHISLDSTAPSSTARRSKLTLSAVSCVRCCAGGSSVRFNSNYACLLSPFAYLCTGPPPRIVSAV